MTVTYINKIIHNIICTTDVYSKEISNIFLVGEVSGLVKRFNFMIFSDTVKLYMSNFS